MVTEESALFSAPRTAPGWPSLSAPWTAPVHLSMQIAALSTTLKICTNKDLKEQLHVEVDKCLSHSEYTMQISQCQAFCHGPCTGIKKKCESVREGNE